LGRAGAHFSASKSIFLPFPTCILKPVQNGTFSQKVSSASGRLRPETPPGALPLDTIGARPPNHYSCRPTLNDPTPPMRAAFAHDGSDNRRRLRVRTSSQSITDCRVRIIETTTGRRPERLLHGRSTSTSRDCCRPP